MLIRILAFLVLIFSSKICIAETYEINFRNRSSQTLTSAVCALHKRNVQIFVTGEPASSGLAELAQDGVETDYAQELRATQGVRKVKTGPFVSGKSRAKFNIRSKRRRGRLSCVLGMLVATNDAFPAFRNLRLPRVIGNRKRFRAPAYDAGSEVNTESCDHVPGGPCDAHFVGEEENGTVERHPGILGIADLDPDKHGWREPVVRGFVTRIK